MFPLARKILCDDFRVLRWSKFLLLEDALSPGLSEMNFRYRLTSSETRVWLSLRLQASFRFQNSPTLDYAPSIFKKFCKIENSLSIFRTLLGSRSEILALWWLSFHFQRTFLLQMSACQIRFAWCLPFRVSCQMPLRKAALLPPLCTVLLMDFLAF